MQDITKPAVRYLLRRVRAALSTATAALLVTAFAAPAPAGAQGSEDYGSSDPAGYDTGYSYLRVLDGSATLIQGAGLSGGGGDRVQAEINQPVLAGDRLWVGPRSRAEVLLSDRNLLRLDGETEVAFEQLAFTPESGDRVTTLRLLRGNAQLVVTSDSLGDQLPRVDTLNAAVYPQDFGVYRVTSDGGDWTEVVVRRGRAEVVGGRDTVTVDAGDKALIEGRDRWADVRDAGGYDGLERWGADLERRAEAYDVRYVDDDLRYAAASLDDHGRWVDVRGSYAWRPRVDSGWRPYWHGRWAYTPAGVTWVSSEPWGWVPYHYGTWDYAPGFGWVWFPGRRFSPAWVYWHWGPSHVAWVPVGYYTRHYHHRYPGFRSGVYGWAGGDAGFFADWVFCDRRYFGHRQHRDRYYRGHDWRRHHGGHAVPRGILTTDTRPLEPSLWDDPEGSIRVLRTRPGLGDRRRRPSAERTAELPDVTPFIARRGGELPGDVAKRVAITRGEAERVAGTPLAPGTRAPEVRLTRPRTGIRGGGSGEAGDRTTRTVVTTEPGVRSVRPSSGIRGDGSGGSGVSGDDRDRGSLSDRPSSRSGRPVAIERTDAPRADSPRADSPRREGTAAGRPGIAVRRTPPATSSGGSGGSDDRGDSIRRAPRAERPDGSTRGDDRGRSGITVRPPRAERPDGSTRSGDSGGSGTVVRSPRAERPDSAPRSDDRGRTSTVVRSPRAERPESSTRSGDDGGSGIAARSPRAERPDSSARGGDRSTVTRSTPAPRAPRVERSSPRAERPSTQSPAPRAGSVSGDRKGSPPARSRRPEATVQRSSPSEGSGRRAVRPSPRNQRPTTQRAPARRAPSTGLRAPSPRRSPAAGAQPPSRPSRSAPTVRSQPSRRSPEARSAPRRAPSVRSQPAPRSAPRRSAPVVRSQPSPSRSPSARSAPRRSAPSVRSQPSRSSAPRSTPRAGSSSRGGSRPSAPRAFSGSSRSGGGEADRRGGRDRG